MPLIIRRHIRYNLPTEESFAPLQIEVGPPLKFRRWTAPEDALIKKCYGKASPYHLDIGSLVARLPGRTLGAVRVRASQLGVTR